MTRTKPEAAAAARISAGLALRKRLELLQRLRPCFARTEPWLQARKYTAAVMSELAERNGWSIARHAGDKTPDKTQRLLNHASWDTCAAMGVVRRFAAAGLDQAARRGKRRRGLVIVAIDETGQEKAGEANRWRQAAVPGVRGPGGQRDQHRAPVVRAGQDRARADRRPPVDPPRTDRGPGQVPAHGPAAEHWAAEDLPRHRGSGATNVRAKINALTRLSESLRCRPDHGDLPAALGRADIENFLSRLGYLESAGTISRYHRNVVCRGARTILTGIRALGLTRPGQAAAGLHGDVTIGIGDIPAEPVRGEPGRDLPPEIMTVLCASLDTLQPPEVQVATQIAIDTGRRPEDILGLPLDCLAHDKDGATVLVYDNAKANRIGRRLPINQATTTVITGQQDRVRARFPGTPPAGLRLLPAARCNPDGRKPMTIDMFEGRHREWVDALGPLHSRDGAAVDPARVTPYAYRHTYVICTAAEPTKII